MKNNKPHESGAHVHPKKFANALNFSAVITGFLPRLIEKDYFCTLVLRHFLEFGGNELVFKGGTCLAKVHADFYRLSEDLDFTLPIELGMSRKMRSNAAILARDVIASLPERYPSFRIEQSLRGANESTQYLALLSYDSIFNEGREKIKVEIGLREPLIDDPVLGELKTILLDPRTKTGFLQPISIPCMSLREAMAEKFRAALTRRGVAIRDFYDIWHAVQFLNFNYLDRDLLAMVNTKLAVPGNNAPDLSDTRLADLKVQLESQLKPVLRANDYTTFDLDNAIRIVKNVARTVGHF